jgi:peroxiredoxin
MKPDRFKWFLYLALLALAFEVVFLVLQNQQLQARIVRLTNQQQPETLKPGEKVAGIELLSTSGINEQLSFGGKAPSRLLYIFKTSCPACSATLPIWKQLALEAQASVHVMGLSSESLSEITEYQNANEIAYPVFAVTDTSFKRQYKIAFVPQTILVDGDGTVLGLWSGALQEPQLAAIREIMNKL